MTEISCLIYLRVDFSDAIQRIESITENPISWFESVLEHVENKPLKYHFDMAFTSINFGYTEYMKAMELTFPHLRKDVRDYLLFVTREGHPGHLPWTHEMSVVELIERARNYFRAFTANMITARLRMGHRSALPLPSFDISLLLDNMLDNSGSSQEISQEVIVPHAGEWQAFVDEGVKRACSYINKVNNDAAKPGTLPYFANFLENLCLFKHEYERCTTFTDFTLCYYKYVKMQFNISFSRASCAWIAELVESILGDMTSSETQNGMFSEFLDAYKSVTRSIMWEKLVKLSVLLGSLAMCWCTGESLTLEMFRSILSSVYNNMRATEMFGQVLETIQAIYAKCIPVLKGKAKFSSIWQGLGDGRELDLNIVAFITHANKYVEGTADSTTPEPEALMCKAVVLLEKLTEIMKATMHVGDRQHVKRTMLQIESLRNAINNKHSNAGIRAKPYTISLYGTTGVGKTCLSFEFAIMLQKALNIDCGSNFIFRLDEQDEYHSSLTTKHNCYVIDDLGNTKTEWAKVVCTEPIIAMSNNAPKYAVMADLASKGVVAMRPKILIATTNVKRLHAGTYSVAPEAVLRRFEAHITVKVRSQYADENGQLREDVNPVEVNYNCWVFTVEKFSPNSKHPKSNHGFIPVVDEEGLELLDVPFEALCRHLVRDSKKHHKRQNAYVEMTKSAPNEPYCACGIRAVACPRCETPQAGIFSDLKVAMNYTMGLREVLKYPVGRGLIADHVRGAFVTLLVMTFAAVMTLNLYTSTLVLVFWGLALAAFLGINAWRVATYEVKYEPRNVCQMCASSYRDYALGSYAKMAAAFVGAAGMYMAFNKVSKVVDTQGSVPSRPKVAFDVGQLPDNWKKVDLAPLPSNPEVPNTTGQQLAELVSAKLCSMRVFTDTLQEFSAAMPVCTNFWIVPHHQVAKEYEKIKLIHASEEMINYSTTFFKEGTYRRIGDTDMALVYVPARGDQRDLIKYFPTKDMFKGGKMNLKENPARLALLEQREKEIEGTRVLEPIRSVHGVRVTSCLIAPQGIDKPYWGGAYDSPVATFKGMCGCPIIAENSGPYFVGFHSAGVTDTKKANYCTVMREDLLECIEAMTSKDSPMMQGSESSDLRLDSENMPFKHEIPARNHIAFMKEAQVDVLGSHAGKVRRYTSMVQPTDYSDDIEGEFSEPRKHGKPALMNHWYPPRLWAESCGDAKPVHLSWLRIAYNNYKDRIFKFLKPEHKEQIVVLEDVVNTSGLDGYKGLDKMNYAASAGIPYCKPKRDYVKLSDDFFDGISVPYVLTDEMKKDVKILEDIYRKGQRGYAPHRANRKDEAIKLDKAKVRIFSGTNMPYLFLMRKYFLAISVFMQQHPEVFESAVGTNPYGPEWTKLYEFIAQHGIERVIAGDYEKYDQFVHSMLTYAAFKVLILIAEWAGFDEEDLMIMRGLATDTCNPVYELDGLWLKFGSSSPSGHGLTVVLNGIINSFYARIAYYVTRNKQGVTTEETKDFNDVVAFMSYGDDNVMSVSEKAKFFNHCTYQEALKVYGLNYTMADKTTESVPYIHMKEASFLKRTWVWSEEFGRYMAPLEQSSIFKMLHTFTVSKVSSRQQQLADILRSANQEFFMHGDQIFTESREKLMKIAEKFELTHFMPGCSLPTLDEMKSWYAAMN